MEKTTIKAKNIVIGKEVEVILVNTNYSETLVEAKIVEGQFNGAYVIVNKADLVNYVEHLTMEEQIVELCKEMEVNFSNGIENEVIVEGFNYTIYINIDEELKEYNMCTLNTNINWATKQDEDVYFDMASAYKNNTTKKTLKAVKNYITKYVY